MPKKIYYLTRYLMFLPVFIYIISFLNPDPDSYFLIATGRYILENKTIPTMNPFTIDSIHIIVQQWFVSIINALLYDNFGKMGLIVYSSIILVSIIALSVCYLRIFSKNRNAEVFSVFFILSSLLVYINTRPNSLTINIFLLLLIVLEKYNKTGKNRYLLYLLLLSVAQINVHAAMWFVIFPFVGIYILPSNIKMLLKVTKKQIKLLITFILMIFVGIFNPNGIDGMLYIFKSLGSVKEIPIAEMKHPEIFGYPGIIVIVSIVLFVLYVRKERNLHIILLSLAGIICSSMYVRNTYMATICLIPVISKLFVKPEKERKTKEYFALIISYLLIMITLFAVLPVNMEIEDYQHSAVKAFDYLDTKDNVVLFTGFNTGSYAEFRGYKVFVDGRAEIFGKKIAKEKDVMAIYSDVYNGNINFEEFIEDYHFTHLLVSCEDSFETFLRYNEKYVPVVVGSDYILYEAK